MSVYGSDTNFGGFEDSFSEKSIRHAFIKKVYSIIMVQLAITTGFICLFLYEPKVKLYSMQHPEMFWIALVLTFILIITLACCESVRRSFPANFICLFLFTFFQSFLLGSAASRYDTEAVMIAVAICAVVCLGLTIFAFQTKTIQLIYASLGAIVFSMYLVLDTQLMIGGKHRYSSTYSCLFFKLLDMHVIRTIFQFCCSCNSHLLGDMYLWSHSYL
ncbi:protein lifeguard 2 [Trichonephila inaurata madagascariensis]|uniref:Protein lifeguard 2 n=1 Tax=Trichonephila inaurata madagascariensis TaxID=2747483 RepID=A0A8X6X0L3_9ARAC|nr:protein lifeguard 2 [Trichonephila inaurata madagascariensis]